MHYYIIVCPASVEKLILMTIIEAKMGLSGSKNGTKRKYKWDKAEAKMGLSGSGSGRRSKCATFY